MLAQQTETELKAFILISSRRVLKVQIPDVSVSLISSHLVFRSHSSVWTVDMQEVSCWFHPNFINPVYNKCFKIYLQFILLCKNCEKTEMKQKKQKMEPSPRKPSEAVKTASQTHVQIKESFTFLNIIIFLSAFMISNDPYWNQPWKSHRLYSWVLFFCDGMIACDWRFNITNC